MPSGSWAEEAETTAVAARAAAAVADAEKAKAASARAEAQTETASVAVEAAELDRRGSIVSAQQGSDVDSIGGPPRTLSALESYRAWERSIGLEDHRQGAEQEGQSQGSSKKSRRKKPPPRENWLHFSVFSVTCYWPEPDACFLPRALWGHPQHLHATRQASPAR